MSDSNRDLLVLSKSEELSPEAMQREVDMLNTLLYHTENWETFCVANEVLDINRRKVITRPLQIQKMLREKKNTPFVFTSNKN